MNIDTQKEELLQHKKTLEEELATVGRKDESNPGGYVAHEPELGHEHASDENDLADEQEEFGNNNAIVRDLETRLQNVNKALENIENNTYGTCTECKQSIEEDRLEALPSAQTCKAHMG